MVATNRFKKDFGYYFLGIIVPGILHASLIPIIKHLLGTEVFGSYSLKFNFLLLLMATLIGGICQGVIRFKVDAENYLKDFYIQLFRLVKQLLLPVAMLCFLILFYYFKQTVLLSVLFSFCVIAGSVQSVLLAIGQANFQSKFIMLSEGVRALAYFVIASIALSFTKFYSQELLFLSLLLSYITSIFLLSKKNKITYIYITGILKPEQIVFDSKAFIKFGFPLSLWFAIYYFFTYADKPLLANDLGLKILGNYQAMFDIIFRGITGIMSPFPIAVMPILTQAFQQDKNQAVLSLLKKLIFLQLVLMMLGTVLYWILGFDILAKILVIPVTVNYKISGLIMVIACMLWQIGYLNQNPFKLIKRTDLLLKFMFVSMIFFVGSLLLIRLVNKADFYFYTFPFLISGLCYNILCIGYFKINKMVILNKK